MSTRSTLTIKTDATTINFYRHMDGYVSEAGNTIAQLLTKVLDTENAWQHPGVDLAKEIIKQQYEANIYPGNNEHSIYELTDNPADHSDREWHYQVEFLNNRVSIKVYDIKYSSFYIFEGNLEQYKNFVTYYTKELNRKENEDV